MLRSKNDLVKPSIQYIQHLEEDEIRIKYHNESDLDEIFIYITAALILAGYPTEGIKEHLKE